MSIASIGRRVVPAPFHASAARLWRATRAGWNAGLERLVAGSRAGQGIYYGVVSDAFAREHRAVAAGRAAYRAAQRARRRSSYLLRRNTHRLEKGLIMTDRRKVFALDFIAETVAEFKAVSQSFGPGDAPTDELRWARDVLREYFAVTDPDHPLLAALRAEFEAAAQTAPAENGPPFAPFHRDLSAQPVSIEALTALARRRRSVRHYERRPVARDVVDRALAVAAQSPSACNRQAFRFLIFDDPALAPTVAAVPAGTKTFFRGVPSVAVLVGRLRAYPRERDRHAIYVDASLAAMAFIYGLECQGVASCAINWADEEPAESRIASLLSLEPDERVVVMISFGWPDPQGRVPYSAKRPPDEFRVYNPPIAAGAGA